MDRIIYIDGIFDLFHKGHVLHLKKIKELDNQNNYLIVGIISDKNAEYYKRLPIYDQENRKILIESCKYVDKVIENAPLIINEKFIQEHKIDLVCHAFSNKEDEENQRDFYETPIKLNKFRSIQYFHGISTSDIINKIIKYY